MKTEVGLIPEDWNIKSTIDCAKNGEAGIKIGPFGSALKKDLLVRQGYKVYGQENVFDRNVKIGDRFITLQHFRKLKSCELLPGDFIVSMMGTIGQCMILPENMEHGIMDSHLLRIKLDKSVVHPEFFEHVFSCPIALNQVKKLSVGGIMDGLSSKIVKRIQYPLPPTLNEQKAIATALSDIDALISNLERLITKKKAIKHGVMQELLTPPHKGGKRLPGFSGDWEEKTLGEVAEFFKGKGLPKSDIVDEGKYKCIHYGELFTKYNQIITSIRSRTNQNYNTFLSRENDVLMPTSDVTPNGLATASALLENDIILGGDILVIRPNKSLYGAFLSYQVSKHKQQIMSLISGTTVYHLYGSDMAKFIFNIPNIEEQKAIIKILSDMDLEIEALEAKKGKYQGIKQGMMQELLTGKTRLV